MTLKTDSSRPTPTGPIKPKAPEHPPAGPSTPTPEQPKQAPLSRDQRQGTEQGHASSIGLESAELEAQIQDLMKSAPKGIVGEAVDFWHELGQEGGVKGAVGKTMEGLLEFSGLPSVERSAGELGARVGAGDSNANIAKAGAKLAFHSGVVLLNGIGAGKAVTSALSGGSKLATAAEGGTQILRHYTSAEKAAQIMKSGEIWASKAGNAGINKVYLLAEEGGNAGMHLLRRFNIGYSRGAETAKAVEINLAKLPPEVAAAFKRELAKGPLALEQFITHSGNFNFNAFREAVTLVDTQKMAVTMEQVVKAGGSLLKAGALVEDFKQGVNGASR